MDSIKWAPLVYGPTWQVDFRGGFLAEPEDFTPEDAAWALAHVLVSTTRPERLEEGERWLVFKDGKHCVVGVTCMGADVSDDCNRDRYGRPIYVFLGYVCGSPIASLPPRELEFFRPLYRFIRARWEERSDEKSRRGLRPYELLLPKTAPPAGSPLLLNRDVSKVHVWPHADREILWRSAAGEPGPVSLCLGLAHGRDALRGPCGNVTVMGAEQEIWIERPVAATESEGREALAQVPLRFDAARQLEARPVDERTEPADKAPHEGCLRVAWRWLGRFLELLLATLRSRTAGRQRRRASQRRRGEPDVEGIRVAEATSGPLKEPPPGFRRKRPATDRPPSVPPTTFPAFPGTAAEPDDAIADDLPPGFRRKRPPGSQPDAKARLD